MMIKHHSLGKSRDDAREAAICTCFNLRKAARAVTQLYDAALGPSGLRATQFSLIAALGVRGAPTISQLAKAMVMDRTTLTRNLKPLEKQGLVAVVAGEDRRTRHVRLTPSGHEVLTAALPLWRHAQGEIDARLGAARRGRLLVELSATVSAAQEA